MHLSKGVQKNILKLWNFTENKLCHRCFDNNLQKIIQTNITREILLRVNSMVALCLEN